MHAVAPPALERCSPDAANWAEGLLELVKNGQCDELIHGAHGPRREELEARYQAILFSATEPDETLRRTTSSTSTSPGGASSLASPADASGRGGSFSSREGAAGAAPRAAGQAAVNSALSAFGRCGGARRRVSFPAFDEDEWLPSGDGFRGQAAPPSGRRPVEPQRFNRHTVTDMQHAAPEAATRAGAHIDMPDKYQPPRSKSDTVIDIKAIFEYDELDMTMDLPDPEDPHPPQGRVKKASCVSAPPPPHRQLSLVDSSPLDAGGVKLPDIRTPRMQQQQQQQQRQQQQQQHGHRPETREGGRRPSPGSSALSPLDMHAARQHLRSRSLSFSNRHDYTTADALSGFKKADSVSEYSHLHNVRAMSRMHAADDSARNQHAHLEASAAKHIPCKASLPETTTALCSARPMGRVTTSLKGAVVRSNGNGASLDPIPRGVDDHHVPAPRRAASPSRSYSLGVPSSTANHGLASPAAEEDVMRKPDWSSRTLRPPPRIKPAIGRRHSSVATITARRDVGLGLDAARSPPRAEAPCNGTPGSSAARSRADVNDDLGYLLASPPRMPVGEGMVQGMANATPHVICAGRRSQCM